MRIPAAAVTPALGTCAHPLAADLLARLRARGGDATPTKTTRAFSRRDASRIYRRKAAKGDRPTVRTEGYAELLAALDAAPDGEVIVHGLTFSDAVYLVFTDPGRTECLGVLRKRRLSAIPSRQSRMSSNSSGSAPGRGGYADVNGIRMYYEVHGQGDGVPLVLLPGGGSTIEVTFGQVLPVFARHRKVIAIEEQGHGRTSDRDQPVKFETSADDVAELLAQLQVAGADLFGFSNGAGVALQVAIRHPALVRKLVFASAMAKRAGAQPQLWEFMEQATFANMPQSLKEAFLRVNPDPHQLRVMHDKDAERMRNFTDIPDSALKSVRASTLLVLGDQDIVRLEHAVELTRLIPAARLLVLAGGHGDYIGEAVMTRRPSRYPELTAGMIEEFLDAP
ncbi:MAG TPA: alpha/beta hydrolase [Gemmatimonadales bacterium]